MGGVRELVVPVSGELVNVDVEVGVRVQSCMFRRRCTQADVAAILGVAQATVSRKLHGSIPFTVAELVALAQVFRIDPGSLLPVLEPGQRPVLSERPAGVKLSG